MTNDELQTAIDSAWRNHGRCVLPGSRQLARQALAQLLSLQVLRATDQINGGLDPFREPALTGLGAPTVDAAVMEAQKPHCIHGRRMPVAHLNDPGEPCELCEEDGNGVSLSQPLEESRSAVSNGGKIARERTMCQAPSDLHNLQRSRSKVRRRK